MVNKNRLNLPKPPVLVFASKTFSTDEYVSDTHSRGCTSVFRREIGKHFQRTTESCIKKRGSSFCGLLVILLYHNTQFLVMHI